MKNVVYSLLNFSAKIANIMISFQGISYIGIKLKAALTKSQIISTKMLKAF